MKPFIRGKLPIIMIVVQALLIAGLLLYIVPGRYRLYDIVLYDASENVPANPLIGYAPDARRTGDCEETSLVFIELPFSEWEPQEGVFDTASLVRKYHVEEYRQEGKHAVLRFVCDIPGDQPHRDIPDWLYRATGDGLDYDGAYGKGYAPDYENEVFLKAHGEAIRALADWCAGDGFVAFVEMGSVGPRGVWARADSPSPDLKPSDAVLDRYAGQYIEAFPSESGIRLLRSAGDGSTGDAGSWNDVLGEEAACGKWALENAGLPEDSAQKKTEAADASKPADPAKDSAEDAQKSALWTREVIAGGLTDTVSMDELLMSSLSDTLEQIRKCHISFIGPNCPDSTRQKTNGSGMILRDIGYCIYLSRLQTTVDYLDDDLLFHFTFSNIGRAPMYWDWPVRMYVYDKKGACIEEQVLDLKLSELLPGREVTVTGSIPYSGELLKGYSVGIAITNPEKTEYITLAQKGVLPGREGIHRIYRK